MPKNCHSRLSIASFNVNRLVTHLNQVKWEISDKQYNIFAVGETFLNDSVKDEIVNIEGYKFLKQNRVDREGVGVALYVRNFH